MYLDNIFLFCEDISCFATSAQVYLAGQLYAVPSIYWSPSILGMRRREIGSFTPAGTGQWRYD